eukprot:3152839-Amphidinium_carterae.1
MPRRTHGSELSCKGSRGSSASAGGRTYQTLHNIELCSPESWTCQTSLQYGPEHAASQCCPHHFLTAPARHRTPSWRSLDFAGVHIPRDPQLTAGKSMLRLLRERRCQTENMSTWGTISGFKNTSCERRTHDL